MGLPLNTLGIGVLLGHKLRVGDLHKLDEEVLELRFVDVLQIFRVVNDVIWRAHSALHRLHGHRDLVEILRWHLMLMVTRLTTRVVLVAATVVLEAAPIVALVLLVLVAILLFPAPGLLILLLALVVVLLLALVATARRFAAPTLLLECL